MGESEVIRRRARRDLVVITESGLEDVRLWEHSLRVTRTACLIAGLPDLASYAVDLDVVNAIGMYHDAGWITQYKDGDVKREDMCCRLATPVQRELSAGMLEKNLAEVLPGPKLEAASRGVRMLSDHEIDLVEAKIVAEADNLDEFGALYLWHAARRNARDGKGLDAAIETWETQKQYGYWTARIKDSFRFPTVQRIATERLVALDQIFQQMRAHHCGDDLHTALTALPVT